MKRNPKTALLTLTSILTAGAVLLAQQIGDVPAITTHLSEADIESGRVSFQDVVKHGEKLFNAVFNRLDGQGRPGTTADGQSRSPANPRMLRQTGPDAHSCASCHNRPRSGGGGDFPNNVFVGPDSSNERMTVSLFGSG